MRTKVRGKIAWRALSGAKRDATQRKVVNGFYRRSLTRPALVPVADGGRQFTRECLLLLADGSLTGQKVALALSLVVAERGAPTSITVDRGSEFYNRTMEACAYISMVYNSIPSGGQTSGQ